MRLPRALPDANLIIFDEVSNTLLEHGLFQTFPSNRALLQLDSRDRKEGATAPEI
jgi:hypothetical protein